MRSFLINKNLCLCYWLRKRFGRKWALRIATSIEKAILIFGRERMQPYRDKLAMIEGEKMKATMHYLMTIFFFVSLLIGQLGCAHTPQHPSQGTWACSAEGPEFNPHVTKGQGLRMAKGGAIGLAVGTGTGALVGALVGVCVAAGTGGIGIVALPYLAAGGAAIGGAIGGVSGGVEGAVRNMPPPDDHETVYNTWNGIRFVKIDSLRPILQWKPFPAPKDIEADKTGELSRVSDVTYELKILRAQDSSQGEVVYTRKGLQEPSHKVERPLDPLTRYFWSVRVRFQLDGHDIETKWSACCPFYTTM